MGHRRIALVGGDSSRDMYGLRLHGCKAALEGMSAPFRDSLIKTCVSTLESAFEAARWISELSPPATAAICYNDLIAPSLHHGLVRHGLAPGRNFALIGHENLEEVSSVEPPLSVTTVSMDEMGMAAASALLDRIEKPDSRPKRVILQTRLVIRSTCGVSVPREA